MNKPSNWRRRTLATVAITRTRALCLIMGPLDMQGLLELLRKWVRSCMVLGMCGLDVPTSICMITSFLATLLMNLSSICLNRTVACQATFPSASNCEGHAGLCHQLSQGTAAASCCGRLVAAMEVQHCPSQRDH